MSVDAGGGGGGAPCGVTGGAGGALCIKGKGAALAGPTGALEFDEGCAEAVTVSKALDTTTGP